MHTRAPSVGGTPRKRTTMARVLVASIVLAAPGIATSMAFGQVLEKVSADSAEEASTANLISAALDVTMGSRYLFQGFDYSAGRPVVQPEGSVEVHGFSGVAWLNFQPDLGQFNEVDLTLKYGHQFGLVSVEAGYTHLGYPNRDWEPSQEVFLEMESSGPLNPSLSLHYDFEAGRGAYASAGMNREIRPWLGLGAKLFTEHHYYEMSGISGLQLKSEATFHVGGTTFCPSVSRLVRWDNGSFRAEMATRSAWLLELNIAGQP